MVIEEVETERGLISHLSSEVHPEEVTSHSYKHTEIISTYTWLTFSLLLSLSTRCKLMCLCWVPGKRFLDETCQCAHNTQQGSQQRTKPLKQICFVGSNQISVSGFLFF